MKGEINAAMKEHGHGEIVRKLKFNNISIDIFIIYIIKVDHIIKIPYKENSSSYFDLDQRKSCNVNPPGISYTLWNETSLVKNNLVGQKLDWMKMKCPKRRRRKC